MANGDNAIVQARWVRRDWDQATERALLVVGYHIENIGSNVWDDLTYDVRAHLVLADGAYVRDPFILSGNQIPTTLATGERFDSALVIGSNDVVSPAALYDPDTIIIVNVVREGVTWMNSAAGVISVDAALDRGCPDFVARADRAGLVTLDVLNAVVPTDPFGSRGAVLPPSSAPTGHTLYFVSIDFAVTVAPQRVVVKWTPREDGVERIIRTWQLPIGTTPIDLGLLRLGPGDSLRIDAEPNEDGGGINGNIRYIDLPWLEAPTS